MVMIRTWAGIRGHLPVRWSEWVMALAALSMSAALTAQPWMFGLAPHYEVVASWAEETTWAWIVFVSGMFRIFALAVNGTFQSFPYSAHLRATAAFVGFVFWGLFAWGFILSAFARGTSLGPIVSYGTLAVFEFVNLSRSSAEVGAWLRERT